jgi:hypothetical protein
VNLLHQQNKNDLAKKLFNLNIKLNGPTFAIYYYNYIQDNQSIANVNKYIDDLKKPTSDKTSIPNFDFDLSKTLNLYNKSLHPVDYNLIYYGSSQNIIITLLQIISIHSSRFNISDDLIFKHISSCLNILNDKKSKDHDILLLKSMGWKLAAIYAFIPSNIANFLIKKYNFEKDVIN